MSTVTNVGADFNYYDEEKPKSSGTSQYDKDLQSMSIYAFARKYNMQENEVALLREKSTEKDLKDNKGLLDQLKAFIADSQSKSQSAVPAQNGEEPSQPVAGGEESAAQAEQVQNNFFVPQTAQEEKVDTVTVEQAPAVNQSEEDAEIQDNRVMPPRPSASPIAEKADTPQIMMSQNKFAQIKEPSYSAVSPKAAMLLNTAQNMLKKDYKEVDGSYLEITQGRKEAWCANTVNYIFEKTYGTNIFGVRAGTNQYKAAVFELKDWGQKNKTFVPATKSEGGKQFTDEKTVERIMKGSDIKPGDVIIWDACSHITVDGKPYVKKSSHIGILKEIKDGKMCIYEGNANYYKTDANGGYLSVKTAEQGKNGDQEIGELQEINESDQFLLKEYDVKALMASGFSGYIKIDHEKIKPSKELLASN